VARRVAGQRVLGTIGGGTGFTQAGMASGDLPVQVGGCDITDP
jgi:hypothetical protein